jgi:hypothetical protein
MGYPVSRNPEGRPPEYGETKQRVNMTLTPTSIDGLDLLARALNLSRSEFVERIGRGIIPLGISIPTTEDGGKPHSNDDVTAAQPSPTKEDIR